MTRARRMMRVRPPAAVALALVAIAALAGCTTDAMPIPGTLTAPPPATAAPAAGTTLQPAPAATGTPVDAAGYATLLTSATVAGVDVDSTDRNIACTILDPSDLGSGSPWASCSIAQKDFVFPAGMTKDPAASALEVGGAGQGRVFEVGDFVFPGAAAATADRVGTLPAGRSLTWSTVTCLAIENGIRCTDTATSHGFFLSRIKYELF